MNGCSALNLNENAHFLIEIEKIAAFFKNDSNVIIEIIFRVFDKR